MAQGDRFRRKALKRGYKVDEVDEFLERAEATLARRLSGEPVSAADVRDVVFRTRFGGYDEWQVDLHLDRLEKELDELNSGLPARGSNGFRALEAGPSAYRDVPAEPEQPAYAGYAPEPAYGAGYRSEPSGSYGRPGYRPEETDHGDRPGYGGYRDEPPYREEPAYRDEPPYRDEPAFRTGGRAEPVYGTAGAPTAVTPAYREEPSGGDYRAEPAYGYDRGQTDTRSASWATGDPYREETRYRDSVASAPPQPEPYREEAAPYSGAAAYGSKPTGYGTAARYGADTGAYEQPGYAEPTGPIAPADRPGYVEETSYGERSRYADYAEQPPYADRGRYVEPSSYPEPAPYAERSYSEGSRFNGAQYAEQPGAAGYDPAYETGYQESPSYSEGTPRQPAYQPAQPAAAQYQSGSYGRGGRSGGVYPQYDDSPSYGDLSPFESARQEPASVEALGRRPEPSYRGGGRGYGEPESTGVQPLVAGSLAGAAATVPPPRSGRQPAYGDSFRDSLPPARSLDPDYGNGRHGSEPLQEAPVSTGYSPFTNEDKAVVGELRSSFRPRRFGSGYDPAQVERLFDAIQAMMEGRGGQVSDADLMPGQFGLVQGGYFEDDVDEALRQVRALFNRRIG